MKRSLFGLAQALLYWYTHSDKKMTAIGFKRNAQDPCLFVGHGMVVVCYVDDCLFFGPDESDWDKVILELETQELSQTQEDVVAYAFLGGRVTKK